MFLLAPHQSPLRFSVATKQLLRISAEVPKIHLADVIPAVGRQWEPGGGPSLEAADKTDYRKFAT